MSKTRKHKKSLKAGKLRIIPMTFSHRAGTIKNNSSGTSLVKFQEEITIKFLELLMMIKLYHWKTFSYSTHKSTDDLYDSLNENIDTFMEVLFGKTLKRSNLVNKKTIQLIDLTSPEQLKQKIMYYKSYLVGLDDNKSMRTMSNSDLYNIRDEILASLNKFMYLLTLK
jgi:DNA-binding ferritin-like protein